VRAKAVGPSLAVLFAVNTLNIQVLSAAVEPLRHEFQSEGAEREGLEG